MAMGAACDGNGSGSSSEMSRKKKKTDTFSSIVMGTKGYPYLGIRECDESYAKNNPPGCTCGNHPHFGLEELDFNESRCTVISKRMLCGCNAENTQNQQD